VHQILLREEPTPDQAIWLSKLNTKQTDIHLSADLLQMNVHVAAAKKLTRSNDGSVEILPERVGQARDLAQSLEDFLESIESLTAVTNEIWKPETIDLGQFEDARVVGCPPGHSTPPFSTHTMLSYRDLWLAYLWKLMLPAKLFYESC
jgi:hypothetical protein